MWRSKRKTIFTRTRLLATCVAYAAIFSGFFIVTGLAIPDEDKFFFFLFGLIAVTVVVLPIVWPSYRVTLCGVLSFWTGGLLTLISGIGEWRGLVEYFGRLGTLDVALEILRWPIIGSFLLGMISTALSRLRLPRQYPSGHCTNCGYDLCHLPHSRCPECGTFNSRERAASRRG